MYRRALQTLFLSTLKRTSRINRTTPCSCFHTTNLRYADQPPWLPAPEPEVKKQFAELDPDTFGSLSEPSIHEQVEEMPEEEGDCEVFDEVNDSGKKQRKPMFIYHKMIASLLKQKKVADAIDVLETRMLKQDRVKPDYYCFNLLINGCAKVGYCEKAFKLYYRMKQRQIKITPATLTGLINSCAMSPFPEDALIRLNNLRKHLMEDTRELSIIHYNCMIKAYARLNDVQSAFSVADEALSKGFTMQNETLGSLLQACISDKECGLRHALLAWHKMRAKKMIPDLWNYNLLIRCIRDCGVGDADELQDLVLRVTKGEMCNYLQIIDENRKSDYQREAIEAGQQAVDQVQNSVEEAESKPEFSFAELEVVENRPNLLARKPHLGNIISVGNVKTATDRLLLLGGYKTLLKEMENDGVKPDIKTFTQLLNIMPSTSDSEKYLMKEMKKYKVDLDIDFCNMLIKQRAVRMDYEKAKEVLSIIQDNYLQPDIVTFGVLAMSCGKKWEAEELIEEMNSFGYRMNIEILGAMLSQACFRHNFEYAMYAMRLAKNFRIQPTEQFMNRLAELDRSAKELRRRKKRKDETLPRIAREPWFQEASLRFHDYYIEWKKDVAVFKPPHPYRQFRKSIRDVQKAHSEGRTDRHEKEAEYYGNTRNSEWKNNFRKTSKSRTGSDYSEKEYATSDSEVKTSRSKQNPRHKKNYERKFNSKSRDDRFPRTKSCNELPDEHLEKEFDSVPEYDKYSRGQEASDRSVDSIPHEPVSKPLGARKLKFKRSNRPAKTEREDPSTQIAIV